MGEESRLTVQGLEHRFGPRTALAGIDLRVDRGEVVGLIGRNGAGKTTTMRAVMGILTPSAGEIRWQGAPLTAAVRRSFGYMPEERGLYPAMTLLEQAVYFGRIHRMTASDARRAARAWIDRLELTGREGDKLSALSHGNQQRAQLLVALVHTPPLVVLDEPFSGLDPETVDRLSQDLRRLADDGMSVIFSSHQLELVARLCDRIVILDRGRVRADGTLAQLRATMPVRWRVTVSGAPRWAERLDGVRVVEHDGASVVLDITDPTSPRQVLAAAMEAGVVEQFGRQQADLNELFLSLVAP